MHFLVPSVFAQRGIVHFANQSAFELADSPSNLAPIPISCYNTGKEQPSDVRKSPIGFEPTLFIREPENSGRSWYAPLRGHQQ